jgi:alkanesulfonate monooxygenase SsuD/methylene tetrahydromethanopterin reductase-like flavin-dependent oxidoreductase (luciferase family)
MAVTSTYRPPLFGYGLGSTSSAPRQRVSGASATLQSAVAADAAGLDLVSVSDHPYRGERLDAYAALGVILGRTERIGAFANVTNLPTPPAPILARTITSLSALSGGRVVLGIGAGGSWDHAAAFGVGRRTPAEAVRAMDEAIRVVRALCGAGGPLTFPGEFYQLADIDPAPVTAPPIWTGSVGRKSLEVTGRRADGWIVPLAADWRSPRYRESRPHIDEAAAAAGRDPSEIIDVYNLPGAITDHPLASTRDEAGRWIGGSVEQWVSELTEAVVEYGAGVIMFHPADDPKLHPGLWPCENALELWSQEIVPAVREAVGRSPEHASVRHTSSRRPAIRPDC